MAPFTHPDRQAASSSDHHGGERSGRGRGGSRGRGGGRGGAQAGPQPGGIPTGSVSKLKAQIRQTTRLLAKEDLNADVRLTSERRLQTLEAELAKASTSNLEKKMVTRYRGIKFFERQKILRKIKQAKAALASSPSPATETALLESRIDLYYILTYSKTSKYIALFPEGTYVPHSPPINPPTAASKSREQLREGIKSRMESGELGAEPEAGDLEIEGEESVAVSGAGEKRGSGEDEAEEGDRPAKKSRPARVEAAAPPQVQTATPTPKAEDAPLATVPLAAGEEPREMKKGKKHRKALRESEAAAKEAAAQELATGGASGAFAGDDFFE